MATNIKVSKADCYASFANVNQFTSPPPGSPPATQAALENANVEIFPADGASDYRRIRWLVKVPVLATEASKEEDALSILNSLVSSMSVQIQGEIGFASGISILSKLRDIARDVAKLLEGEKDSAIFRVNPFPVKFEDATHYGYVVSAEARWFKTDADDPADSGEIVCQELEDTNPVNESGEPDKSTLDKFTDKFRSPLLVSSVHELQRSEVQTELDVVASVIVDYETFTPGFESFLTVVREIRLEIFAGDETHVQAQLQRYRQGSADRNVRRVSQAIDGAGRRIAKAIELASASQGGRAAEEPVKLGAVLSDAEEASIDEFLSLMPERRLATLALTLGVSRAGLPKDAVALKTLLRDTLRRSLEGSGDERPKT